MKAAATPCCSARLLGIKRKDYIEHTSEYTPNDYRGENDWEDDQSPSAWATAGRDNDDFDDYGWRGDNKHEEEDRHQDNSQDKQDGDDNDNPEPEGHGNCYRSLLSLFMFYLSGDFGLILY